MKKLFFLIFALISLSANAQIFNHKTVMDKFDDAILDKNIKTLIERNDTAFIIEEKGLQPVTYIIQNLMTENSVGSKDEIVNLVNNVYGYQECWSVILEKDMPQYAQAYLSAMMEEDENNRMSIITKMINAYNYYIIHRVVTTQYTHQFLSEYYWVQKGDTNGRTIYSNQ